MALAVRAMPALHERHDDIELLARHIAAALGCQALPEYLVDEMKARAWPGNVRELKNALRAYIAIGQMSNEGLIDGSKLNGALESLIQVDTPYAELKERINEAFLRVYVRRLLKHTRGNQSEASRLSGLERSYFSKLVRRFAPESDS